MAFLEDGSTIFYIPSLRISAYGDNFDEAKQMAEEVVDDFFKSLLNLGESEGTKKLIELGWKRSPLFKKRMEALSTTTFEDIKREFNIPDEVKIEEVALEV